VASNQSAVQSSITLTPVVVSTIIFSWASGLCTSIFGCYKLTLVIAFVLMHVGSVLLWLYFKPGESQALAAGILLILGIGFGCQLQNTLVACQSATRQREMAMATAVRNCFVSGFVLEVTMYAQFLDMPLLPSLSATLVE